MIPAPVDLAARLHSIDDVIERARAAQQAIADATALRVAATRVRHQAMLEAYERHGFTSISLGRELGISGARALVLVTEARVIRDREMMNRQEMNR